MNSQKFFFSLVTNDLLHNNKNGQTCNKENGKRKGVSFCTVELPFTSDVKYGQQFMNRNDTPFIK